MVVVYDAFVGKTAMLGPWWPFGIAGCAVVFLFGKLFERFPIELS
jgi:hypothetical protein